MLLYTIIFKLLTITIVNSTYLVDTSTVAKRALQKSHEKPRIQKLSEAFLEKDFYSDDPDASLINLLNEIAVRYLSDCATAILYDNYTEIEDRVFLTKFLQQYRLTSVHGSILQDFRVQLGKLVNENDKKCVHFIIFIKDIMKCTDVISKRNDKVVVVAKSSQWRVQEFLYSEYSQEIANLLVIVESNKFSEQNQEIPYIIYTHKLFVDALGSSQPVVLTSWSAGKFSRNVSLFQAKLTHGFSGHRFIIAAGHQPPFVIKKRNDRDELEYNGIEIKLVNLLSEMYNFSTDYKEPAEFRTLGSGEAVIKAMKEGNVNLGIAGLYITENRFNAGIFHWHTEDCAAFISLGSTALPRYRAIMGPFHWTVWLALIMVYFSAIFLFTYSDKSTLKHLIKNPEEMENMFWYVFGTFTNCFTFSGGGSWTKAQKGTTKLLVGIYWLFTIIITACYTGSIIAFVTLPVFPSVIDTIYQLLDSRFQIGMLNKGWPQWFQNMSDTTSQKLLRKVDYVPDVESGLKNVTKAFFWPYALLGSQEELAYIVKTNFTVGSKRSLLHISQQCFVPFKVGIILPNHAVYSEVLAKGIQMILQSGFNVKMKTDVEWDMMKTATGKLLAANSRGSLQALSREDRALTLDDTQGMFLLLAFGFAAGGAILLSEIFGGCFNICKKSEYLRRLSSTSSIPSNPRFHEGQTNRDRLQSMSLNRQRHRSRSLKSNEIAFDTTNIEEPFGENLIHHDISHFNKEESDSSDSQVDYNEEITKIFNHALENKGYDSNGSNESEEKNYEKDKKFV